MKKTQTCKAQFFWGSFPHHGQMDQFLWELYYHLWDSPSTQTVADTSEMAECYGALPLNYPISSHGKHSRKELVDLCSNFGHQAP